MHKINEFFLYKVRVFYLPLVSSDKLKSLLLRDYDRSTEYVLLHLHIQSPVSLIRVILLQNTTGTTKKKIEMMRRDRSIL